jgi:hypothetical protein
MRKDDPTIQAVREARQLISTKVGHDPRKLVDHYRQLQERHRERLLPRPPQQSVDGEESAA